uniref:Uncharacterized protein n=1 Tax=Lactuca sativa TaxID=4236 RepID=A0A9R1UY22_LACSA|nr:hypothetical protein LSAT_V11C700358050 [Lactuca sativa]
MLRLHMDVLNIDVKDGGIDMHNTAEGFVKEWLPRVSRDLKSPSPDFWVQSTRHSYPRLGSRSFSLRAEERMAISTKHELQTKDSARGPVGYSRFILGRLFNAFPNITSLCFNVRDWSKYEEWYAICC